ncbi:MAG: nucleoside kinase [Bacteroidales bacterium]|nr:nucleoside kinase [Bacteroidales bacterium]
MNTIEVIIENTGERRQVEQGTTLAELAGLLQAEGKQGRTLTQLPDCQNPILCALVNNEVTMLDYRLFNPKSVRFVDISHQEGYRIYITSLCFLLYKAVKDCYPEVSLSIEHSMSDGFFFRIMPRNQENEAATPLPSQLEMARTIREHMLELQHKAIPFTSRQMLVEDAVKLLENENIPETRRLIGSLSQLYIEMQFLGETPHKWATKLVPHTGVLTQWDLRAYSAGFLLQCPDPKTPEKLRMTVETPKLFAVFEEHHQWAKLLHVPTITDLNDVVRQHNEKHLIHVAEALHERKYATIADMVGQRRGEVRMVLLAGPSSSGKTTSCRRLAVHLSVLGFDVKQLSLDDYFLPRERTPRQPNGDYDFEALEALDIPLLNQQLQQLFAGEEVAIPTYDFIKGEPYFSGKTLQMKPNSILIVEGIHALNPSLTADIDDNLKFKVYVSALTQIAIDQHNIIRTSDNRLIRRIVRDNKFRGYSAFDTLKRWGSVRDGELKHIFPFQEEADIMFNSALLYELGILKPHAEMLLKRVPQHSEEYAEAQRLLNFLELVEPIETSAIPPTSILREFLGGSSFEY